MTSTVICHGVWAGNDCVMDAAVHGPLNTADLSLFVGRKGDLYVLLSTRAGDMRSYAADTALPGGKYDEGDEDEVGTAVSARLPHVAEAKADLQRREAYEEVNDGLESV